MVRKPIFHLFALFACWPLAACTLQPVYVEPAIDASGAIPVQGGMDKNRLAPNLPASDMWWTRLNDPAIDQLTLAAMQSSPTLEQAAAKVQEARANEGIAAGAASPSLLANGSLARAKTASGHGSAAAIGGVAGIGLDLSWEADLFGKLRESRNAAHRRIGAREADAALVRLSLAAQVASGVVGTRACLDVLRVRANDIASRSLILGLIQKKRAQGLSAPVNESRAMADLASAQTAFLSQKNACDHGLNELVFLSGVSLEAVQNHLSLPAIAASARPSPLALLDQGPLPASILRFHPRVIAAEREFAAAYAEIGVARAARYPALSLSAMLSGQWLSAAGTTLHTTPWSAGASLAGPVFDGGKSASNVDAAVARWQAALAVLSGEIRRAAQDVENALADQESTTARVSAASTAATSAKDTLRATEAQWRAGAVSLFELQDAARTYAANEEIQIAALRDRALAWVALIKATANAHLPSKELT